MDAISLNMLLEYLYKKFAVTFVLILMGSFLKQSTLSTKRVNKINIASVISPTIFSSVLLCAISEYLDIPFSLYAVISILVGMWSLKILRLFLDIKFIKKLTVIILKNISGPLNKYTNKLADDIKDEIDESKFEEVPREPSKDDSNSKEKD